VIPHEVGYHLQNLLGIQNQGVLESGDIEEALTHGTSEQRLRWFKKGYDSGDMRQGDTFNTPSL
jgi:predicted metalloprotease